MYAICKSLKNVCMCNEYRSYKDPGGMYLTTRYVPNGRMRYNHGSISDIKPASYVHHSELWQGPYNMPGMYKSVLIMATFVPLQENRICLSINICTNGGLSMSTVM